MEINKIKRSLLVLFLSFLAIGAQAQLEQADICRRYSNERTCSFETGFGLYPSGGYAEIVGRSPAQ